MFVRWYRVITYIDFETYTFLVFCLNVFFNPYIRPVYELKEYRTDTLKQIIG